VAVVGMTTLDLDTTRDWIEFLYPDDVEGLGLLHVSSNLDNFRGRAFDRSDLDGLVEYVAQLDAKGVPGIYLRTTTVREGVSGRGAASDTVALVYLWADLDIAGPGHAYEPEDGELPLPPDQDEAKRIVKVAGLPEPTAWVHSGGGLYPIWLFDNPVSYGKELRGLSKGLQKALEAAAKSIGYHYDPRVGDLARILRLPGTVNRKPGTEPRACRVLSQDGPTVELVIMAEAVDKALEQFGLNTVQVYDSAMEAPVVLGEAAGWLTEGDRCQAMEKALGKYKTSARHNTTLETQVAILRLGEQGHRGGRAAWDRLRSTFLADVTSDGSRTSEEAEREWSDMASGAPKRVVGRTRPEDYGCCGEPAKTLDKLLAERGREKPEPAKEKAEPEPEQVMVLCLPKGIEKVPWFTEEQMVWIPKDEMEEFEKEFSEDLADLEEWERYTAEISSLYVSEMQEKLQQEKRRKKKAAAVTLPDSFWSARPVLAHIRQAAHARGRAADLVLGATLARLSAMVHPGLRIDTGLGTASLNLYVAAIGRSGIGKSTGNAAGREVMQTPGYLTVPAANTKNKFRDGLPVGTGEGLIEAYMDWVLEDTGEKTKKGETKYKRVRQQVRQHVFVFVDEGQNLVVQIDRTGSSLGPVLRSMWSGELAGMANAREETTRILEAGSYALGLVIGFQRKTAGPLLDDAAAGTPQRFLWFSATDPSLPDIAPEYPGQIHVRAVDHNTAHDLPHTGLISFAPEIKAELWETNRARVRGEDEGEDLDNDLDSHVSLLRCKVAGLLALLDDRREVNAEDWQLAGQLHEVSRAVRQDLVQFHHDEQAKEQQARADAYVSQELRAQVARGQADATVERVAAQLARKIHDKGTTNHGDARKILASRDRPLFSEALDLAKARGWLETDEDAHKVMPGKEKPAE
jgi:hypothetical protein